jgi:ribonuclease P protein component
VLPASHRMTRSEDFTSTVRRGRDTSRVGTSLLVLHQSTSGDDVGVSPPRVGFVVSRAVGGAVVRNRTKRQLRHLVGDRIATLPAGSRLVVRALPAAGGATGTELAASLDTGLSRLSSRRRP